MSAALSCVEIFLFFFKQKTAYEVLRSLVGSEMCIRDRSMAMLRSITATLIALTSLTLGTALAEDAAPAFRPVSYTHLTLPTIYSV